MARLDADHGLEVLGGCVGLVAQDEQTGHGHVCRGEPRVDLEDALELDLGLLAPARAEQGLGQRVAQGDVLRIASEGASEIVDATGANLVAGLLSGQGRQLDTDLLLLGVELQRLLVGSSCARRITLSEERAPEVVVVAGQAGIELVHLLELLHGLRRVPLGEVGETQQHPRVDLPGTRGDQGRQLGDGLIGLSIFQIQLGERHDQLRRLRVERERRLQDRDGLLESSIASIDVRQHQRRGDKGRPILEHPLEQRHRFGVALAVQGETCELEARGGEALVRGEGTAIFLFRLLGLFLLDVHAAEQGPRLSILAVGRDHLLEVGDRLVPGPRS
jgi:hypothetical protein